MQNPMRKAHILLPAEHVAYDKWAVVACDQFTSQPDYWRSVEEIVGDAPSTLRLTLPEIWLGQAEARVPQIHAAMERYLRDGVLKEAVDGFVLVERTTASGVRPGLVAALDLEAYDFAAGSRTPIRATEGTVPSRVPPRAAIRRGAALELPHVMMLVDDKVNALVEPLWAKRDSFRKLYDVDLMMDGGHLAGWAVEGEDADSALRACDRLMEACDGLLFAVGDGNHSLAAARQCWLERRETLTEEQRRDDPARFALVEIVNLNCPAMQFEPIHRVLFNVDSLEFYRELRMAMRAHAFEDRPGSDLKLIEKSTELSFAFHEHPLPFLQGFLDQYLVRHPETSIDYIHGEEAVRALVGENPRSMGFLLRPFDKAELFGSIRRWGALPRKTFSMGEATEKRYYMEARSIRRDS
ncbi:MAG: DUF1015 domain-containing protein [Clostridiales bacterium]|nr:DUF1015 domain-containing protein [Clostridiales bacterium]